MNATALRAAWSLGIILALTGACGTGRAASLSGVDLQWVDDSVRPQDDIYRHLHGKWLDSFQIPNDRALHTALTEISDATDEQLKTIVLGLAQADATGHLQGTDRKIADLYASFMDEPRLEALGSQPLEGEFRRIARLRGAQEFPALIAHLNQTDAAAPYDLSIQQDAKDSTRYAVNLAQSGLGLPDRDYYLKNDPKYQNLRAVYRAHIGRMLGLLGDRNPAGEAAAILDLETALARIQWSAADNRDPVKTYNKMTLADLGRLMPGFGWQAYFKEAGIEVRSAFVIVNQPGYFQGLPGLIAAVPLAAWKAYFRWRVLSAAAPYLSKPFVDERFAFAGTTLRGIPENQPRWRHAVALVNGALGDGLGRLYVERYFPPENKTRIQALVRNLIAAYRVRLESLDWMSEATKTGARQKLARLATQIGYPDHWRDYSALTILRGDLLGNVMRANAFEYRRNIAKLGLPIDRGEWEITPQTVNAYYDPTLNEVVFPAAILQPPFFNVKADDAVNYGAIGGAIAHEISHGFDDEGSQFDAAGNLRDWFTPEDHEKFAAKTRALVAQYARYEPIAGHHVDGELTLSENIADNAGLAVAYEGYELSLAGRASPVIDGMTGEQRLFYGWVQVARAQAREEEAVLRLKTDPHAPLAVRGAAPLRNLAGFYGAFGVKPGDKMYLPPEERVTIW